MRSSRGKKDNPASASLVLPDNTIVETVFNRDLGTTQFVLFRAGVVETADHVTLVDGSKVAPFSPKNNLLTHGVVVLASGVQEYHSPNALRAELLTFLQRYCDVTEDFAHLATQYVLMTWIYDAFNEVPYLRVRGDYGTGKTRILQTLGVLCYKSIFASGASTVSPIFRTLDAFQGTLILDEGDFRQSDERSEIAKILNNGHARGFPVLRSEQVSDRGEFTPTAFHVYGPKIIATRSSFSDRALESRCITHDLSYKVPRPDIPLNLPDSFHVEALQLRNKLLRFRFAERFRPRDLNAAKDASLDARISQVFAPLLVTARDQAVETSVRLHAAATQRSLSADRAMSIEAQLLEVIDELTRSGTVLSMKEIAQRFESLYFADCRRPITPRWVGGMLRSRLQLTPIKSNGVFVIPDTDLPHLDGLLQRYGIRPKQ